MGAVARAVGMPESPHPSIPSPEEEGRIVSSGAMDSEPNIRNKLSRSKFTAVFFIQCLMAIEVNDFRVG